MSALTDLIDQVADPVLRSRLHEEANRLLREKKFGLVFEEHLPECTPLWGVPLRPGSLAARKVGYMRELFRVLSLDGDCALCVTEESNEPQRIPLTELVTVAKFGEAIYPCLQTVDSIENAPDSDLWHTLIEADNYHALQLLEYLYRGKVDCIYIDPPYNTGARDWKYNNDYVDGSDSYRHSKWLSMMKKRLILAKKLLNPADSVLIVTIDEKEYLHLGCLLEELFPEAHIQMISDLVNRVVVARDNEFGRSSEYIFIIFIGDASPCKILLEDDWNHIENTTKNNIHWANLSRTGTNSKRQDRPKMFYPIFVSEDGKKILDVGFPLSVNQTREDVAPLEGSIAIWPIHSDGTEGRWMQGRESLLKLIDKGYVKLGKFTNTGMAVSYLNRSQIQKIESGECIISGYDESGTVIVDDSKYQAKYIPDTQWNIKSHDASRQGTNLLISILRNKVFSYPKSLYAVHDTIRFFVANKPNAIIVDFFAGSGTTLHAVNLLNAEYGGNRRCILVTNNEVSADEAKTLTKAGHQPGDEAWEKLGIARYVTWPRTVCSIKGEDVNGEPLKGNYLGSDIPMSDGFKANAVYFKLGFLDKNSIAVGRQFCALLSTLWMKVGAIGKCPELDAGNEPKILVLPENHFAVLTDENYFADFQRQMSEQTQIATIFFVTDSESNYKKMAANYPECVTYQLYRDYLTNFTINVRRD